MMPTEAIAKCISMGFKEREVNLDLVMIETADFPPEDMSNAGFVRTLLRLSEIRKYYGVMGSVIKTMRMYPSVNYRYLVRPEGMLDVDEVLPINFSQPHIQRLIALGDAQTLATVE